MRPEFNSPLTAEMYDLMFGVVIPRLKENKPGKLDMVSQGIHAFLNAVALPMLPSTFDKLDDAPELQKLIWEQMEVRYLRLKPQMEAYFGNLGFEGYGERDCGGCGEFEGDELESGEFRSEDVRTGADISQEAEPYPSDS